MKILLDENIDVNFAKEFSQVEIYTVHGKGWASKKNGELLELTSENEFDYLITLDKNIKYQQNLNKYNFRIILLLTKNSRIETLKELLPKIQSIFKDYSDNKLFEIQ